MRQFTALLRPLWSILATLLSCSRFPLYCGCFPHYCGRFPHYCGRFPHYCGRFPHYCGRFPHYCGRFKLGGETLIAYATYRIKSHWRLQSVSALSMSIVAKCCKVYARTGAYSWNTAKRCVRGVRLWKCDCQYDIWHGSYIQFEHSCCSVGECLLRLSPPTVVRKTSTTTKKQLWMVIS